MKLLYIVWLASYLVRFRDEVNATWMAMLKPLGVAVVLVGLLILQPDFGSLVADPRDHRRHARGSAACTCRACSARC